MCDPVSGIDLQRIIQPPSWGLVAWPAEILFHPCREFPVECPRFGEGGAVIVLNLRQYLHRVDADRAAACVASHADAFVQYDEMG